MTRWRIVLACAGCVGLLTLSAVTAQAAASGQDQEPSPTPQERPATITTTSEPGRLATLTPLPPAGGTLGPAKTPTLIAPPGDGGRVAVETLYVRDTPSFSGSVLGVIPYNQSVYPVGRNADSTWIAVNWGSKHGWVYAEMVVWDTKLDLTTLPLLMDVTGVPPTLTALGTHTEAPATPQATNSPTATLEATASATPTELQPTPTETKAAAGPAPIPTSDASSAAIPASLSPDARLPLFGGIGLLVIAGLLYGWQWSVGRAETRRYAKGFILSTCPVCQEGHIHLDEVVRQTLGIQWVRRSARCSVCRSVLRELRPGQWRYSVDAFVNPEMAERFRTKQVTNAELQELARHIVIKPTQQPEDEPTAKSLNLTWLEIEEPPASGNPDDRESTGES